MIRGRPRRGRTSSGRTSPTPPCPVRFGRRRHHAQRSPPRSHVSMPAIARFRQRRGPPASVDRSRRERSTSRGSATAARDARGAWIADGRLDENPSPPHPDDDPATARGLRKRREVEVLPARVGHEYKSVPPTRRDHRRGRVREAPLGPTRDPPPLASRRRPPVRAVERRSPRARSVHLARRRRLAALQGRRPRGDERPEEGPTQERRALETWRRGAGMSPRLIKGAPASPPKGRGRPKKAPRVKANRRRSGEFEILGFGEPIRTGVFTEVDAQFRLAEEDRRAARRAPEAEPRRAARRRH